MIPQEKALKPNGTLCRPLSYSSYIWQNQFIRMKISLRQAKPIFSLAVLILVFGTSSILAQWDSGFSINKSPLPAPTSPIMDYVGVIDAGTKSALEKRVIDYKASTGVELAVAVVNTTGERPIEDYSIAVARGWGIGSQEDDNPGALLFIAIDDRKYFTQISRDLEDELPDALAGSLQRQFLVPQFKSQNYGKGIADTIDAYIRTIDARRSGGPVPTPVPTTTGRRSSGSGGFSLFCCLAGILVLILIIWSNRRGGGSSGGTWGSGGSSGGSVLPWIIGSAIANAASSSSSSSSDWGSGWSSGGSSGSDWGGFGGGGDFGGGGAGGDW